MSKAQALLEQSWYNESVDVAKQIQTYLTNINQFDISLDAIHATFPDFSEEEVSSAMSILVSHAALYPDTAGGSKTFMLNKTRLASALL